MTPAGLVYHVLNRTVAGLPLFRKGAEKGDKSNYSSFVTSKTGLIPFSPCRSPLSETDEDIVEWLPSTNRQGVSLGVNQ